MTTYTQEMERIENAAVHIADAVARKSRYEDIVRTLADVIPVTLTDEQVNAILDNIEKRNGYMLLG